MSHHAVWRGPAGRLGVVMQGQRLAAIERLAPGPEKVPMDPSTRCVLDQLQAWFEDPNAGFELELVPAPTRFQAGLRQALLSTVLGQIVTYGGLARTLGSSPRAVGAACGVNPVPIVVPCHRVVAAHGWGGYGGEGANSQAAAFKRWLLEHEARAPPR